MDVALARNRTDVVAAVLIVVYAAVMTGVVALVSTLLEGTALLVVSGVVVLVWLLHAGTFVVAWRQLRKVAFPLGVHGDGVHDRSRPVELVLPWAGIRSATLTPRILRSPLLKVEPVDPEQRGIRYSLRILEVDAEELRRAFTVQSGGRVQLGQDLG